MHLHQVLARADYGDAITNEALRLHGVLQTLAPSEVYAIDIDPRVTGIRPLSDYPSGSRGADLLIAHVAVGSDDYFRFLRARTERLVLRYHGAPPPEDVEPFDHGLAERLRRTGSQLAALAPQTALALAVSRFAERDLQRRGFGRSTASPLVMGIDTLLGLAPASVGGARSPRILCVGRLAPTKGLTDVVLAFHVLKTYLVPTATLVIAGGVGCPEYRETLDRLIDDLGLTDVQVLGRLAAAELARLYRDSRALICLSAHETFCAPLVEAMAFGLPVVASNAAAIAETLGGAGLLLPDRNPTIVAEALAAVIDDSALRDDVVGRGHRRALELMPERTAPTLVSHIAELA